jgi:hypothetical protein
MSQAKIDDAIAARTFMFAGNARFTLKSAKTGNRYTFRVAKSEDGRVHFVSLLAGPDNESDYVYVGIIRGNHFTTTAKSKMKPDSEPIRAFDWTVRHLIEDRVPTNLEFWHEGRCGRCARTLTDPESISAGYGPECIKTMGAV